ncbi:hypothetical protein [Wolbachia endosymbiont of Cardiocondyla obscurior]|uniref:hypothetical protein n=1 Tax=Wolbachia endosymbiont of Cardiocondyla obscurior TaxID=2687307 RepID=UPI00157A89BB|nr:hypothetical protein [Wolbachia endosymbiont of Cardiocondyla obscurior]
MPNRETVRALVSAFNVHNYARNTVKTNFKLQSEGKKGYIVVSFDKGMKDYQCSEYLYNIKRKIVGEFYGIEEGDTDEVVLNTANLIFNTESFPFNTSKGEWSQDEQGRIEFLAPIDKGVIFNLKSHLASSLKKDILEGMPACRIVTKASNKKDYLWHGNFDNQESCKQFKHEFLSRMKARYENVPKKPLEVKGNSVYIKDVFDDARFIDSVTRYKAWLVGMYLGVDSSANHKVKLFKDMIIESIGQSTGVTIYGFVCASPLGKEEASILIPLVLDGEEKRILTNEEALELNCTFNCAVFYDLYGRTQGKLSINESSGMYSINFSNPYISHCVITKIIESSVINKDHELSIDPELRFRALSRSPSTELLDMKLESPTRSPDGALKDSPRQGSEKEEGEEGPRLLNYVNSVRTSDRPLTDLSYATTSCGVPGISRDLSAVQNVQAGPSGSSWTRSEPSSSKGAEADDESMPIEIRGQQVRYRLSSIPSPRAWKNSTFLNLEVSNEESEKQQVTDESDRKSSDEYSDAKSQDSKSPKKHRGGLRCSERKPDDRTFLEKISSHFRRNNKGRNSVCSISSSLSAPGGSVPEKLPVSESSSSFPGRIKAKSNPPSAVTSPTHEGGPEWQQRLDPDQREELCKVLPPEMKEKLNSHSFSPGEEQHLYLTRTLSGKRELSRFLCESKESQLRRLAEAQLSSPDNSNRDSGFSSMGSPASPVVQHKGSAPLKVTECSVQQVNSHSVERT